MAYPEVLQRYSIQGEVDAEFVVDSSGYVDPESLKILKVKIDRSRVPYFPANSPEALHMPTDGEAQQAFESVVRRGVMDLEFYPAMVGVRHVRQLVRQPFTFTLH